MKVSLPLLKVVEADPALTRLLLNHLLQSCSKHGQTIDVPEGTKVEEVPMGLYAQERHILTELHSKDFAATEPVLALNQA